MIAVLAAIAAAAGAGTASTKHGFRGLPDTNRPLVVWAIGDGAAGTAAGRRLAQRVTADDPDRVLYLGDVYETGSAQEFRRNFARPYRPLLHRMLPTPGNHEWPQHAVGYDPFWRRVTGARTPPWYAVRLGSWQVLSLNSEAPHDAGSAQVRWLRGRLRRPAPCRLAIWHRPRFSAGLHGDQPDLQPVWAAVRGRVVLVLGGHDHDLQRLRPKAGTVQLVSGAGGRALYDVDEDDPRLAFSDDRHFGAYRLTLSPDHVEAVALTVAGRELDRTTIDC
ncbi:MAG: hypothetical protein QOI80_1526 [Solirubrobacteraceae bacterium]|nr:hypothetical protein [Solirubrobacteraceae bacterium]